jgi:PAT family beta-lactamase induction signal transducer AmpG
LASVGRTYISAVTGYVAEAFGWPLFFVISAIVAIPSFLLLAWLQQRGHFVGLTATKAAAGDD